MRTVFTIQTLILSVVLSLSATSQEIDEQLLLKNFHSISSEEIAGWMAELCSPEYNGRLAGTPEYKASAEWVAGQLHGWGIKPAGDNGTYYQWFDHRTRW
jgi:hypothetical protein